MITHRLNASEIAVTMASLSTAGRILAKQIVNETEPSDTDQFMIKKLAEISRLMVYMASCRTIEIVDVDVDNMEERTKAKLTELWRKS